jgi:hypothetical protein
MDLDFENEDFLMLMMEVMREINLLLLLLVVLFLLLLMVDYVQIEK